MFRKKVTESSKFFFEKLVGGPSVPGGSEISKTVTVDR